MQELAPIACGAPATLLPLLWLIEDDTTEAVAESVGDAV